MDAPFETFQVNGLTVLMYYDDSPPNPRKDFTQFSGLYTWSWNYNSPDEIGGFPTALDQARERWLGDAFDGSDGSKFLRYVRAFHADTILAAVVLTHDQNGLGSYTIDDLPRYWRGSRFTGIGLVTREGWAGAMGEDYSGDVTPEQLLADEINLYNAYASGDCFGYVITDEDGKELDSLWGMYEADDDDYVRRTATESAQGYRPDPVKEVIVTAVCTATVTETWKYRVPVTWQRDDSEDAPDVLDQLNNLDGAFVSCKDDVDDEHDREITGFHEATE